MENKKKTIHAINKELKMGKLFGLVTLKQQSKISLSSVFFMMYFYCYLSILMSYTSINKYFLM